MTQTKSKLVYVEVLLVTFNYAKNIKLLVQTLRRAAFPVEIMCVEAKEVREIN